MIELFRDDDGDLRLSLYHSKAWLFEGYIGLWRIGFASIVGGRSVHAGIRK